VNPGAGYAEGDPEKAGLARATTQEVDLDGSLFERNALDERQRDGAPLAVAADGRQADMLAAIREAQRTEKRREA
jgi:hypothetical protein